MATKTRAGQRHTVAWSAGSRGWGARGPRIETQGSHHIIAHPISRQIGFSGSEVRVNTSPDKNIKLFCFSLYQGGKPSFTLYYSTTIPWPTSFMTHITKPTCSKPLTYIKGTLWDRRWIAPSIGIFPQTCWIFYRNAFLIMKLSNPPSFRAIRALIASQSTFEI